MRPLPQRQLDVALVLLVLLCVPFYYFAVHFYMRDSPFADSLAIPFYMWLFMYWLSDIKNNRYWRQTLVQMLSAGLSYSVGALLADQLRFFYMDAIHSLATAPPEKLAALPFNMGPLGLEVQKIARVKVAGYAACFFFGLALLQIVTRRKIHVVCAYLLIHPEFRMQKCSCCAQDVPPRRGFM